MPAHIESPTVEIEPEGLHQLLADASLIIDRGGAVERLDGRTTLLALPRLPDQVPQLGEQGVNGSLAETRIVAVEESII